MHLKIERDGVVLYDGDVDTFEYAEKTDGTVSCVGTPAKPERAAGGGLAEVLKQVGQKYADDRRSRTESEAASKRATLAPIAGLAPVIDASFPTSEENDTPMEKEQ